jgi:hypothetical protein
MDAFKSRGGPRRQVLAGRGVRLCGVMRKATAIVILNEHRGLDRRSVEQARPANASSSRMRASFHRPTAAEPTSSEPAPPQSDCRRLVRGGAHSPLLSAPPAQSIVAQPKQRILSRLSRSYVAFAEMFSQAVSFLNRLPLSRAQQTRLARTPSALRSPSASEPEAAPKRSKRGWAAPSQLTSYPA